MKACVEHGLDFLPQLADRVAMDTCEQRAVAPLLLRRSWREQSAHGDPFRRQ